MSITPLQSTLLLSLSLSLPRLRLVTSEIHWPRWPRGPWPLLRPSVYAPPADRQSPRIPAPKQTRRPRSTPGPCTSVTFPAVRFGRVPHRKSCRLSESEGCHVTLQPQASVRQDIWPRMSRCKNPEPECNFQFIDCKQFPHQPFGLLFLHCTT